MNALICPSPYSLTRVAWGAASPEEASYVTDHTRACAACRGELDALRRQGPVESFDETLGEPAPLPEPLWRAVAAALRQPPVCVRLTVVARGVPGDEAGPLDSGNWFELVAGEAELIPLMAGATRGAPAAAPPPLAGRLLAGAHEALIRRGPGRLTVVMTHLGQPAAGRRVRLNPDGPTAAPAPGTALDPDRFEMTDSSGVAVFLDVPAGAYLLELEGMEP